MVYARHGRELMRLKSSVREPCYQILRLAKVLAEGKRLCLAMASQEGVTVRWGLKEAGVQSYEPSLPRTRSGGQKRHIRPSLWVRQHNMSKPQVQEIR
jgi:ABC-type thiamine transport system ATPase subunit